MMQLEQLATTPVRAIARRTEVRVGPEDPMWKVVNAMRDGKRGAVLVEEDGVLVGIFTERDLMTRLDHTSLDWLHTQVRDVMTPRPMAINPDDTLAEALRRLNQGKRRHLPVVDGSGKILGIISIRDLLAHFAEHFPDDFVNLPPDPDHEASGEWGG
jgi:CBS domain-containing protein